MSLIAKIKDDLVAARKARTDSIRIALLTTLASEIANFGKNEGNRETRDEEALAVLRKFVKNADLTLANLVNAGRDTGAIHAEISILKEYLPKAPDAGELEAAIRDIVAGAENSNAKPGALRGLVMKGLKERFGDRFDGASAGPVVARVLGA